MNTNPTTPMDDQERHTHIEHQTNNNCQQFFGQVTGCVFAMPGSQVTQTPTTSPIPVHRSPLTVHPSPDTPSPEPSFGQELATFEQCLSYAYAQRYPDNYQSLLSIIHKSKWCDKDHARVALAIYQSPIMSTQYKPNTFLDWYRIYCDTFHVQYHNEYTPSHLNENKVSQSILKYLTVPQP